MSVTIRNIEKDDNKELAEMIRSVFRELKVERPGTAYTDPTTDHLFELFREPKSQYFVALEDGVIIGGCGIFPTKGLPENCTELVKLYITQHARGKGLGNQLMQKCFDSAINLGYEQVYLESLPELEKAIGMYIKNGFEQLSKPMGNSGHFGCNIWMVKNLNQ